MFYYSYHHIILNVLSHILHVIIIQPQIEKQQQLKWVLDEDSRS